MKRTKALYHTTEAQFYSMMTTAWGICAAHLPDFHKLKAVYTEAYIAERLSEIDAAQKLPNIDVRRSTHALLRNQVATLNMTCRDNFRGLRGYIRSTWRGAEFPAMLKMAGNLPYQKAMSPNWQETDTMNKMMVKFISDNLNPLLNNDNMNTTFQAKVVADAGEYSSAYTAFKAAKQTSVSRNQRIEANNAIFIKTRNMLADGRNIFRDSPGIRKMFVMSSLKRLVREGW